MTASRCIACGAPFVREPHEVWKTRCLSCWKRSKGYDTKTSSFRNDAELEQWKRRALAAEAKLKTDNQQLFDLATLKRMRILVHPDKHSGSQLATELSQIVNAAIRKAS